MVWCESYRVTSPNTVVVESRSVYLPYCPLPGKEEECMETLNAILEADGGMAIVTSCHFTANPLIYDARTKKDNKPISDIMQAKGIALKWNIPSKSGVVVEFAIL